MTQAAPAPPQNLPPPAGSKRLKRVRTPTVLQMEAVECGAAALAIVLGYFGRFLPLEMLRVECGVSRDGSKASNIIKVGRKLGLEVQGIKAEPKHLFDLTPPFILFWNFNHFLVLEGFAKDKVYLNDPATGPRTVTYEELDRSFTGVAITFKPGPNFQRGGERLGLLRSLARRVQGSRGALAYVVLAGLALVGPGLLVPTFGRIFVDDVMVGGADSWIQPLLLAMALTALMRGALSWLQKRHLGRLETKLALGMASKFLWHVLHLPIEFFAMRHAGDISSRVALNERVARLLSGELALHALNFITVLFYAALLFAYDHVLCAVGIAVALGNLLLLRYVSRRRTDENLAMQQELGKLFAVGVGGLQTIETLKATGSEGEFFARWAGHQAKVVNAQQRLGASTLLLGTVSPLLASLNTASILVLGALRVMDGRLSMGELIAFQSLMASFLQPVNELVRLGSTLQEVHSDVNRLDDVLRYRRDEALRIEPGRAPQPSSRTHLGGRVELREVTFGYSRLDPPLIEKFNLRVEPGSRVALVGGSGSGKSTIARLIAGLYQPWSGEILFDGRPRSQIPREVFAQSLASVDQEIFLFEGTVRDNLTLWSSTIPEATMIEAARDAAIHDDIAARPGGYDSRVEEGGRNFSGGQRQRLELARTLVLRPSVLVLDEATSALDPRTELLIDQNLRRRGCTCIIVAHRLSTIRDCDEILVLDKGKVVERGTHEAMLRAGGPYANLIRAA